MGAAILAFSPKQNGSENLPDLRALVEQAPAEELPALAGRLREAELLAEMRLRSTANGGGALHPEAEPERWITPEEAAGIAGVAKQRIYSWAKAKGCRWASRPTKRCLRIAERGFRRWLESRS